MWWAVAAAAIPYVVSALQKKPKMPGAPTPVSMPDRSAMVDSIWDDAMNPNNAIWAAASDKTMDNVNRALGRRGMGGSSIGLQLQTNADAELARKWMESSQSRKESALNAITSYDKAVAGLEGQNNMSAYEYAMMKYKDAMQRNANQVQGISNMVNAGMGAYNNMKYQDRMDEMMRRDPYPQVVASYGTPGPQYYPPAGYNYQIPAYNYQPGTMGA